MLHTVTCVVHRLKQLSMTLTHKCIFHARSTLVLVREAISRGDVMHGSAVIPLQISLSLRPPCVSFMEGLWYQPLWPVPGCLCLITEDPPYAGVQLSSRLRLRLESPGIVNKMRPLGLTPKREDNLFSAEFCFLKLHVPLHFKGHFSK